MKWISFSGPSLSPYCSSPFLHAQLLRAAQAPLCNPPFPIVVRHSSLTPLSRGAWSFRLGGPVGAPQGWEHIVSQPREGTSLSFRQEVPVAGNTGQLHSLVVFWVFFGFQAEHGLLCSPAPRSRLVCSQPVCTVAQSGWPVLASSSCRWRWPHHPLPIAHSTRRSPVPNWKPIPLQSLQGNNCPGAIASVRQPPTRSHSLPRHPQRDQQHLP